MAKDDNFDMDWDDPFGGDFDLDMDFDMDPFAKKGFAGGMTSGFLSGIVDETVGSGQARMRTLRTVLPSSFSNALDKVSWASEKLDEIKEDFQKQNVESVKYLQNIAGKLSTKMEGKLPSSVTSGMENFSQKDFSSWESSSYDSDDKGPRMEETEEYDVNAALQRSTENQEGMFSALGETLNQMSASVGGLLNGSVMAGNRQLVNIESSIRSLVDYQRNVQLKMDQSKLNLMARSYVADVKYYKFMEKALHTEIAELKKIVVNSNKSDYEKTSALTAGKAFARNKLFNTLGNRKGGFSGLIRDKFGKDSRNSAYTETNFLLSSVVDMMEMSEDMPMSRGMLGNIIGKNMAEGVIGNLPYFFERGAGKGWVEKLAKKNPEHAKRVQEGYGKLANMGNRSSYAANNMTGIMNILAENWESLDEMPYLDYQDYLDNFQGEGKPMGKAAWTAKNAVSNRGKSAINQFMGEMTKSKGTQYTLARRNVKDLNQPGIWKEMNNITLNEVLPGLLSSIHQSVEGLRTGEMKGPTSYSYMRGQFMEQGNKEKSVQADLMPYSDFSRFASAALEMVDSFDPDKRLGPSARKAFAQAITRDVDKEKGFSPFLYVGEIPGISPGDSKEINALMRRHFGVTEENIQKFKSGSVTERMSALTDMGSAQGNERLNKAGAAAANLKDLFPNVAERIDLLRSTGNEQMLRDLGVIYTENGSDKVNMEIFHERIGKFMDNPNDITLRGGTPNRRPPDPGRADIILGPGPGSGPSGGSGGAGGAGDTESITKLNDTMSKLTETLTTRDLTPGAAGPLPAFDKLEGSLNTISASTSAMEILMGKLVGLAEKGQILTGAKTDEEVKQEETAKRSFMDKVKGILPTNLMGKGMDLIMQNQPIVFGSLLGTLGASFIQNPLLAAATMAGGALVGGIVQRWGKTDQAATSGSTASDDEDILDDKGETLLSSAKLKAGVYVDAITKRVISTWKAIRGPIFDTGAKVMIGIKELGGKIFGPDGRAVMLDGLNKAKEAAINAYNFADPIGRIKAATQFGKDMIYQQNVYVKSDPKKPRLKAVGFKNRDYWVDENGTFKPIAGWNEITGPVYDDEGNELISKEDIHEGLITETGQAVRSVGGAASNAIGGVVGMAKAAGENLLARFGFAKAGTPGEGPNERGPGGFTGGERGVETRLDKIYALLSKQFGISVDDDETDDIISSGGERLNSFADKARKAKDKAQTETQDAIKTIADSLGGGDEKKPEEKKGFLGKMMGLFGAAGGFMMNMIKNPIGTIGSVLVGTLTSSVGRLVKIGSALFSGVLGLGSPLLKMMKWGFSGLASVLGGGTMGSITDALSGGDVTSGGNEQGGKRKGRRGRTRGARGARSAGRAAGAAAKGGRLARLGRGAMSMGLPGKLLGGAAIAGSMFMGSDAFGSDEPMQQDDQGDFYTPQHTKQEEDYLARQDARAKRDAENSSSMTWTETAASMYLPLGAAMAAGEALGIYQTGDKKIMSDDGKMFLSTEERNRYEDQRDGVAAPYSLTRDPKKSFSLQKQIRYAQYGLSSIDSDLAVQIDELEQWLIPYVVIRDNRASLRDDAPVGKMVKQFGAQMGPTMQDQVKTWFMARFKPIFLLYNAGLAVARMGDLNEFDQNSNWESLQVVERLQGSLATMDPQPLSIQVQISGTTAIMNAPQTQQRVNQLLAEMRKERKKPDAETALTLMTADESRTKALGLNEPKKEGVAGFFQDLLGDSSAKRYQEQMDEKFKSPDEVKKIDITDMHKNQDTPIDPFTFSRLAIYGNVDNMPWRVDAVLRLERYCEGLTNVMGNESKFTGSAARVLELFKPMFRIDTDLAYGNWMTWFESRFIPVFTRYVTMVYKARGEKPAKAWKSLSATNKAEIARELTSIKTMKDETEVSVWEIESAPFAHAKSGTEPKRAEKYLSMLDAKSSEARLKDPEAEDERSKSVGERAVQTSVKQQQRNNAINAAYNRAYGTSRQISAGNVGIQGGGAGMSFGAGGIPNASGSGSNWSDMGPGGSFSGAYNPGFNPEVVKNAGSDAGVKLSLEEGEQLMLNTMLKHGITDKKQLALGLAMARKETGDYSRTVEDTRWSAPTLKKYFRNVPDMATAQKVAALSPAERAMYVYGRAPKGPTLGNEKPEDGWLYRGRGFFQLTGKDNYEKLSKDIGVDVVNNPRLVSEDPKIMAESAVRFLKNNKAMMEIGQTGNFNEAVRGINGGNAVPDTDGRRKFYQDYLNKLNNGDINVPQQVVADPYAAQPDPVPAAGDQNMPEDKVSGENENAKKASLEGAMKAGDTTGNLNTQKPPTTGAQQGGPLGGGSASSSVSTISKQETTQTTPPPPVNNKTTGPSPAATPPKSTYTPVGSAPAASNRQPEQPKGPMHVVDSGAHSLMEGIITMLGNINDTMASTRSPTPTVRTN